MVKYDVFYTRSIAHSVIEVEIQKRYLLEGTEKVTEQHIFAKCSKCSHFGVTSNLLKLNTSAISNLTMELNLQKQTKICKSI